MKVLALDFDGVIADSQFECLFVGFNSYLKLHKNTQLFGGQKLTFDNFNKLKRKYKKTTEKYKKLRPYVIGAFSFYVIYHIIENNIGINNQSQFNSVRKKLMKEYSDEYTPNYYNIRSSLQKENFKKWLELEIPFKKVIDGIKKLEKKYIIAIATNNKIRSIQGFLKKYEINPKIITDSDISLDKEKQLAYIKDELKLNFSDIHFVDDNVSHFPKLLSLGVNCYLAAWGYNNKAQQQEAKKQGTILLDEGNFYKELAYNYKKHNI